MQRRSEKCKVDNKEWKQIRKFLLKKKKHEPKNKTKDYSRDSVSNAIPWVRKMTGMGFREHENEEEDRNEKEDRQSLLKAYDWDREDFQLIRWPYWLS